MKSIEITIITLAFRLLLVFYLFNTNLNNSFEDVEQILISTK